MNYIRHTRAAFELLASTADATPYHVSLYVALFQQWNEARFPADIVLFKDELMQAAHIGSPKTSAAACATSLPGASSPISLATPSTAPAAPRCTS